MAARKVAQLTVDWVALSAKVPAVARAEFNGFRARYENLRASLVAIPENPSTIDWDYYKKNLKKSAMIDSFEKQYKALKVPYPADTESAKIKAHKEQMEVEIKEEIAAAHARATDLQAKLDRALAEKPYEEMTVDEFLEDKPELKAKIEDDIKNNRWHV